MLPVNIEDVEVDGRNVVVVTVRKAQLLHADSQSRFPHRVGDSYVFLDILGILNALKERESSLAVPLSPGILTHLLDPTQSKRTEPAAGELESILVLLQSPYPDSQAKGFDQLESLAYRRKIETDTSIIEILSQHIGKDKNGLQRGALRVLFVVLTQADPEVKARLVERLIETLLDVLEDPPSQEVLNETLRVVASIPDERVVDRLVKLIRSLPDEEYMRAQPSSIFHSLKGMGMEVAIRKRLNLELAQDEDARTRKRLAECLDYLQRN